MPEKKRKSTAVEELAGVTTESEEPTPAVPKKGRKSGDAKDKPPMKKEPEEDLFADFSDDEDDGKRSSAKKEKVEHDDRKARTRGRGRPSHTRAAEQQAEHDDRKTQFLDLDSAEVPKPSDQPLKSPPFMTTYERVRIVGQRAMQLSMNAEPRVDPQGESDPIKLAVMELEENEVPFIIRRFLPDGSFEDWKLSDFAW